MMKIKIKRETDTRVIFSGTHSRSDEDRDGGTTAEFAVVTGRTARQMRFVAERVVAGALGTQVVRRRRWNRAAAGSRGGVAETSVIAVVTASSSDLERCGVAVAPLD